MYPTRASAAWPPHGAIGALRRAPMQAPSWLMAKGLQTRVRLALTMLSRKTFSRCGPRSDIICSCCGSGSICDTKGDLCQLDLSFEFWCALSSEQLSLELALQNMLVRRDTETGDVLWSVSLPAPAAAAFLASGADITLQPPAQSPLALPPTPGTPRPALPEGELYQENRKLWFIGQIGC